MRKMIMLVVAGALVFLPAAGAAQAEPRRRPGGTAAVRAFERQLAGPSVAQALHAFGVRRAAAGHSAARSASAKKAVVPKTSGARSGRWPVPVPSGGIAGLVRPGIAGDDDAGTQSSGTGQVAVGGRHTCAILVLHNVWCWGANDAGQLGVGSTLTARKPVDTSATGGLADVFAVVQIVAGQAHTCALGLTDLDSGADVYCWGDNGEGQLGDGGFTTRTRPEQVASDAVAVAAGAEHTCALMSDGTVSCWGRNDVGQLGIGVAGASRAVPQEVPGLTHIVDLAAADDNTCAIDADGQAWCWGSDAYGQLGDGGGASGTPSASPVAVTGQPSGGFAAIDLGLRHACALTEAGDAYCWGDNSAGQLGSTPGDTSKPAAVHGSTRYATISAGGDSTCAISMAARPFCWGDNADGQLGTGDTAAHAVPAALDDRNVTVSPLLKALLGGDRPMAGDLEIGAAHGCLVSADNQVYCSGRNSSRQLGTESTTSMDIPTGTNLAPGPARRVAAATGDANLAVSWAPPADRGAAPVQAYAALAFTGDLGSLDSCETRPSTRHCKVGELSNDKRYTVVVGTLTAAGISYSALAYGTPVAGGQGAGLPITGPGLSGAWLLLGTGAALLLASRRPRH